MTKASYNKIALQWADHRNDSFVSSRVIEFADKLPIWGSILDIGCGTGLPLAKYLSDRGFKVTGIDFAEEMIAIANSQNIKKAEFFTADFFDFSTDKTFDGVLAWDSLWHFPKNKQRLIYPKIAALLKPDGYLLFSHGNQSGEHTNSMMGEQFYYSSLSKESVADLLDATGFSIEYMTENYIERDSDRGLVVLAKRKDRKK